VGEVGVCDMMWVNFTGVERVGLEVFFVALGFAGFHPALPAVVGVEGGSDESEDGDDEEQLHGYRMTEAPPSCAIH
jgi:hypothetical protein